MTCFRTTWHKTMKLWIHRMQTYIRVISTNPSLKADVIIRCELLEDRCKLTKLSANFKRLSPVWDDNYDCTPNACCTTAPLTMQHPVYLDRCATVLRCWWIYSNYSRVATGGRCRPPMGFLQRTGVCLTPVHVQICPCPTLSLRNVPLSSALSACNQISRLTHWWIFNDQLI